MLDVTRAHGLDFLFPQNDNVVGAYLKKYGHFAPAEIDLFADYMEVSEPGTFLDLGGNIGCVSLPLAKRFPNWRVMTVEGHRGLAQVLSANAFGNHLYNVQVVRAAMGEAEAIIDFPEPALGGDGNFGVLSLTKTYAFPTSRVLMQRVDDLAPENTRIIKIDVEGYEDKVLRGAMRTLEMTKPILFLESNPKFGASAQAANALLLESGYRLFSFFSPSAHLASPPKKPETNAIRSGDPSVLALPPGAPNLWDLSPILSADEPLPGHTGAYPYLTRYGYGPSGV